MAGQLPTAHEQLTAARRWTAETGERWFHAETLRGSGDVLLEMGETADAEACYSDALRIARQQHAKLWELRAGISLARLWSTQGRCKDARNLLGPVYDWFTEARDTPVLEGAKALLDELAAGRRAGLSRGVLERLPAGGAAADGRLEPAELVPRRIGQRLEAYS
jgi:predicted ATPase